jgi:hypothetical protein
MDNEGKYILDFTFTTSLGYKTHVHKEFDNWKDGEMETLAQELKYCLMACSFPEALVDRYIITED